MNTMFIIRRIESSVFGGPRPVEVKAVCSTKRRAINLLKSLEHDPPCDDVTLFEYDEELESVRIENKYGYIADYDIEEVVVDDWKDAYWV